MPSLPGGRHSQMTAPGKGASGAFTWTRNAERGKTGNVKQVLEWLKAGDHI